MEEEPEQGSHIASWMVEPCSAPFLSTTWGELLIFLVQNLINGLLLAGVYAMIGLGFSLVYGVTNIINLAHGSYIMMAALTAYSLNAALGLDPFLALPVVMAIFFVLGYLLQKILINRIMDTGILMTLVLTFGLSLVFLNLALILWGPAARTVQSKFTGLGTHIGNALVIPQARFMVLVFAIGLAIGFYLFMNKSRIGLAIKATSLNKAGARSLGIDVREIYAVSHGLATSLAAAAGVLASVIYPLSPAMAVPYLAKAFVIAVLGGLGNMAGAAVGGIVLALIETAAAAYLGASYQLAVGFVIFVLVLVFRPHGLIGKRFYAEI